MHDTIAEISHLRRHIKILENDLRTANEEIKSLEQFSEKQAREIFRLENNISFMQKHYVPRVRPGSIRKRILRSFLRGEMNFRCRVWKIRIRALMRRGRGFRMNLFIDTEFDGYKGKIISVGIVSEDGRGFYEILSDSAENDWVKQNVIPILGKSAISLNDFQSSLTKYLKQFDSINFIADWPDDIKYLCDLVISAPGEMINIPSFSTQIIREISSDRSRVPHNAFADAVAIKTAYEELKKTSGRGDVYF